MEQENKKRTRNHKKVEKNQCCICMQIKNEIDFFKRNELRIVSRNYCFECIEKYNKLLDTTKAEGYTVNRKYFDINEKYPKEEERKRLYKLQSILEWEALPKEERDKYYKEKYAKLDKKEVSENYKKYYDANKDKITKRKKEYRSNPNVKDKELAQKREYRNSDKGKAAELAYRNSPAGKAGAKLRKAKRRALELKAKIVKITKEQLQQRMSVFGYKCYYCDGPFEHLDHAIALSKGGYHCLANFRPSCESCNLSKSSKSYNEWIKSLPKFNKDLNKEEIKKENNEGSNKDNN